MAGDSGSSFTIKTSSSGRVVERKSRRSDGRCSGSGESGLVSPRKRSIEDRLETGNDSFHARKHHNSKRHKKESSKASWRSDSNDSCLDKRDLRYKILQKNISRESKDMDLRDRLSRRTVEASHETRKNKLDSRESRQSIAENRKYDSDKQIMHESRYADVNDKQTRQEYRDAYSDGRKIMQQPVNVYHQGGQIVQGPIESCDYRESYDYSRQERMELAPSRSSSNFTAVDLIRGPPSPPWAYENPRQRSPNRSLCSSVPTAYYPERNIAERHSVTMFSQYDDGNSIMYQNNDISSPPRTTGPGTFVNYPASHAVSSLPATRPMPMVEEYHPQSIGFAPKAPYSVEEPTVLTFLQALGLEKFVVNFMAEEVDFNALRQMTGADLKELNIPMGPRKKILQALVPQSRRQC